MERIRRVLAAFCIFLMTPFSTLPAHSAGNGATAAPQNRFATLEKTLLAIEHSQKSAGRDRWDADDVIRQVGREPQKIFAWVNDNVLWIPYRGTLRGPVGVLMDGHANSLDRSLLLATLLEKAGHRVRLAHGTLAADQAARRLPDLVARQLAFSGLAANNDNGLAKRLQSAAAQFAQGNGSAQALGEQDRHASQILHELETRVADQGQRLLAGLPQPDPTVEWGAAFEKALGALQDHWWVQRQDGNAWIDMDGVLGATTGEAATEPSEMVAPQEIAGRADLHHEVALRIVAEQWDTGAVSEHVALERVLRPADLIGKAVALQFWPSAPLKEQASTNDAGPKDFRSAMLDQKEWAALLMIDREPVDSTVLAENGADPAAPSKGGDFGALAGGFGGAPANRAPARSRDVLSAVWLEYEIRVPGEEPRTVRRAIFDLVGPAARTAGAPKLAMTDALRLTRARALMMRTEILALPCRIAPDFVTHLIAASILGNRQLLKGTASDTVTSNIALELAKDSAPTITSLYALALAKDSNSSTLSYVDRPIVFTNHSYPKAHGDGETLVEATDIVANDFGVSLAAGDAFSLRLSQGVRDTNAEALVKRPAVSANTAEAFAASKDWVTLTSPDETAVATLGLSPDARQRVLDDLMAGYTVVVPSSPVPMKANAFTGWWRIHATSGQTLGIAENGWGQAATEQGANNARAAQMGRHFISAFKRFSAGFIGMYGWCMAPVVHRNVNASGFKLGLKISAHESISECVGDSIFVGALVTLPLVALTINRSARAPTPPPEPPPCPAGDVPLELADTQPVRPPPELADTQPVRPPPELADTQPDLGKTQPDPGQTPGDLAKTQPDLGKTQPDMSKSKPGLGNDPALDKTVDAQAGGKGGGGNDPALDKTVDAQSGGKGGGNDPALDKTVDAPANAPKPAKVSNWDGQSPPTAEQLTDLKTDIQNAEATFKNQRAELKTAHDAIKAPQAESTVKVGEWIRYRAKGNPNSPEPDLANYDPAEDARLQKDAYEASEKTQKAMAKWQRTSEATEQAMEDLQANRRLLQRAQEIAKKAGGGSKQAEGGECQ